MIAGSLGKQLRMRRVLHNGRALVLPMDHPIYFGPQPGTEDPAAVVALGRDHGATAVLLTGGALRRAAHEIGDLGVILRIDAPVSHLGGPDTVMHLLHDAEEALALGADMVVVNCYLGMGDTALESDLLTKLAAISAQCERIGLPLCGEIVPRVSYEDSAQKMPTSLDLATAIRIGLEYGCDLVKTVYSGDRKGYSKAVAAGHLPVIMAGGPKGANELAIFHQVKQAMVSGACGAAIGRRVWGSERPKATLEALRAIVMEDATVEDAVRIYSQGKA